MKILKIILAIIIIIVVIVLLIALFVKKEYVVDEQIVINRPSNEVFDYIKLIKNQGNYNKWVMMDPNVRRTYTGTDGTVGFVATWDSDNKNVGKGAQEIRMISEGQRIDLEVRFEKPFKNTANVYMTTQPEPGNATKVRWVMEGKNPYPMNIMNLFIPSMLGKDLATSLNNLKNVLEK